MTENIDKLVSVLERLCEAIEASGRLDKVRPKTSLKKTPFCQSTLDQYDSFIWNSERSELHPVTSTNRISLNLLLGIDLVKAELYSNTLRFAKGLPANNALLWGARGMGKSSLVKAVHTEISGHEHETGRGLKLIEVNREDISTLPQLMGALKALPQRFILFCDDLSFDARDHQYKDLKTILEGGLEERPANCLFYATSNRRHLVNRAMIENEQSTAINPYEAVEENVSLADRFGLWLGFHTCDQNEYIAMVKRYAEHFDLENNDINGLIQSALSWSRAFCSEVTSPNVCKERQKKELEPFELIY